MTRRAMLVALALSCLVVGGTAATAGDTAGGFLDGNKLLADCNDPPVSYGVGFCDGYILGVAGALNQKQGFYCFPGGSGGVKAGQVEDLVKLYLRDHPENRHDVASSLIIAALKEKFPCGE
jgi:hypothetical protein